jgi:hypothetical protein
MKRLIVTLCLLAIVYATNAQSKSVATLREKHKSNEDFFQLELGGNFMNFANGFKIDVDKNDMATVAKSVEKLNFFTLPESKSNYSEFKALQKGLERERYELLLETAEGKSGVFIYSKGASIISDLVILVGDDKKGDLMVIELKGKFTQEALARATTHVK